MMSVHVPGYPTMRSERLAMLAGLIGACPPGPVIVDDGDECSFSFSFKDGDWVAFPHRLQLFHPVDHRPEWVDAVLMLIPKEDHADQPGVHRPDPVEGSERPSRKPAPQDR